MRIISRDDWQGTAPELLDRVASFRAAKIAHLATVDEPAPREIDLVEMLQRTDEAFDIYTDPPPMPETEPPIVRTIPALAFRRRFTPKERAVITLAASRAMEADDATLQVWLDDLNSAGEIDLDHPEIAAALDMLAAGGLLAPDRKAELLT